MFTSFPGISSIFSNGDLLKPPVFPGVSPGPPVSLQSRDPKYPGAPVSPYDDAPPSNFGTVVDTEIWAPKSLDEKKTSTSQLVVEPTHLKKY